MFTAMLRKEINTRYPALSERLTSRFRKTYPDPTQDELHSPTMGSTNGRAAADMRGLVGCVWVVR
jgi:hypothetical protein